MSDITTSHERSDWAAAWEDDSERIIRRVHAALNSGTDRAVVAVVLDEIDKARGTAPDDELTRRLEWATGRNGATLLGQIRAEGLDVITVTKEQP